MRKGIKVTLNVYTTLALITACTPNVPNNYQFNNNAQNSGIVSNYAIRGKAEFPTLTHSPFEGGKGDVLQVPQSNSKSWKSFNPGNPVSKGVSYSTKATLADVGIKATVSIIYPPDHGTNPNVSVGTGLTDSSGIFIVNPTETFSPAINDIYVLEAKKRIGGAGNDVITIRTYIKWDGSSWESMTTPGIYINSKTTALSIIDSYDSSISASDTIGTIIIDTPNPGSNPTAIGSVSTSTILGVSDFVDNLLTQDVDPVRNISYLNNKYYVNTELNHAAAALNSGLDCPNCNLKNEDLSSQTYTNRDLYSANFSDANLTNTDLSNSDLSVADLLGANLTNVTLSGTILSGATWTDGRICAQGSIGNCNVGEILVNTYTINTQTSPAMAMDNNGNFVVIWSSSSQEGESSSYSGLYGQRYNSTGSAIGSEFHVNTFTTKNQANPSVAMDDNGDFIVVWQSGAYLGPSPDGDRYGISAQRYNSDGTTNGSEFVVNTYTTHKQTRPKVAMDSSGNFVVTWISAGQEGQGTYYGIYGQKYLSSGSTNGSEFIVNTYTTNTQSNPNIAMNDAGKFVVTWVSSTQDGNFGGIYAQLYNADGTTNGTEFRVNTITTDTQTSPAVAIDSDGDFVITWHANNQDGGSYGSFGQRFNSSGAPQGSEFQINTFTTGNQVGTSVAMSSSGNFIVTWESFQDGSNNGAYGQRYNSDGTTNGSEFRINTYTTNAQRLPKVVMDSSGNFVTSWQGAGNGDSYGVFLKKYNSSGIEQ